jgi:ATP-dependent DNA ligase
MTRFQELAEHVRDEGRQIFRRMLAGRDHLHYAAFDFLWLNGRDLCPHPLTRRKQRLERLIPKTMPVLSRLFSIERKGRDMLGTAQ